MEFRAQLHPMIKTLMRVLIIPMALFFSSPIMAQVDSLDKSITISKEEAIKIAKCRNGYYLQYAELDSNYWRIVHSKAVGSTRDCITISSGVCGVSKNVLTIIDARTGRVWRKSRYNSISGGGGNGPSQEHFLVEKKTKKMKVDNRKITVYY